MYHMKLTKYHSIQFDSINLLRRLITAEELITGKHNNNNNNKLIVNK
jgi:hypothetical protein